MISIQIDASGYDPRHMSNYVSSTFFSDDAFDTKLNNQFNNDIQQLLCLVADMSNSHSIRDIIQILKEGEMLKSSDVQSTESSMEFYKPIENLNSPVDFMEI